MTTVALLGTGIMGAGMGRSLARAGLDVTVWNRSADKARALELPIAETAADAVRDKDVVVTMLFDAESVAAVMRDALPGMRADAVWVQTSTVGLEATAELAGLAAKHGIAYVDAPVLGTRQPAENGQLTVLAAGPAAARDRIAPVLDAISAKVVWVGDEPGGGHRLKLVANAWVLSIVAATAQSVALAEGLGLDPAQFLGLIEGGPLDSGYAQLKGKAMLSGDFTPAFALSGATKDAGLIRAAAAEAGVATGLVAAMEKLFAAAGDQDDDMAAVIRAARPA
ncbi:NAD(P)-dependent oxidoreductase [Actinophytocola algeriensis]|uniref:3-hydroxyisobutyrate dehydrogenase n=1 Tax=Actinophytocola algeriensis TaxID=1768010 RepID=A0A7W7Q5N3_9PSEU|nr:NAD(P)-dependent oxidoreductase [Actinophytocola algeriensis]MBB4907535.1 3-hydroxyisobutyrate dehydrogenase [Actinophytocola algeriensis]MBE1479565.1 3-hydroxyisobutyrate dehydrogenase [Actinophytocola algeriensis]